MLQKITYSLGLLLGFTILKAIIVFSLSINLIKRWKQQKIRYRTDFPILTGLFFLFLTIGKIIDASLYYYMRDEPDYANLLQATLNYIEFLGRLRFIVTYITVAPIVVLMLIIWFHQKKRLQIGIYSVWTIISMIGIFLSYTYTHFLIMNITIVFLPILLSSIIQYIMHRSKKMGSINNLILSFGWILMLITQIFRPFWQSLGDSILGYVWISEILETIPYVIIWYGFSSSSKYHNVSAKVETKIQNDHTPFQENEIVI
jgi:hypothetical protein